MKTGYGQRVAFRPTIKGLGQMGVALVFLVLAVGVPQVCRR